MQPLLKYLQIHLRSLKQLLVRGGARPQIIGTEETKLYATTLQNDHYMAVLGHPSSSRMSPASNRMKNATSLMKGMQTLGKLGIRITDSKPENLGIKQDNSIELFDMDPQKKSKITPPSLNNLSELKHPQDAVGGTFTTQHIPYETYSKMLALATNGQANTQETRTRWEELWAEHEIFQAASNAFSVLSGIDRGCEFESRPVYPVKLLQKPENENFLINLIMEQAAVRVWEHSEDMSDDELMADDSINPALDASWERHVKAQFEALAAPLQMPKGLGARLHGNYKATYEGGDKEKEEAEDIQFLKGALETPAVTNMVPHQNFPKVSSISQRDEKKDLLFGSLGFSTPQNKDNKNTSDRVAKLSLEMIRDTGIEEAANYILDALEGKSGAETVDEFSEKLLPLLEKAQAKVHSLEVK
jgi:hypothetical protein